MDKSNLLELLSHIKKTTRETRLLMPLNISEEKRKFLLNPKNSPQFTYPEIPVETFQKHLQQLKETDFNSNNKFENYYYQRLKKEWTLKLKMLLNRGNKEYGLISEELYQCNFNEDTIQAAEQDAKLPGDFTPKENISNGEIIIKVQNYLNSLNLTEWKIEQTDKQDFYFRVKANQKKILVGKEINWDFCDLDNTLAHEIDGHVIRGVNSAKQKNPILRKPLPFYIKTEEGLASYLGDYFSTTDLISRKHHALKYLAGKFAKTSSFVECYEYFMDNGFTSELAFRRTFRLKRGFEDTSFYGVYAHEAMYYEGMQEVKNYLDNGGNIKKLYSAKAGIEDLQFVPVVENILLPERLNLLNNSI